MAAERMGASNVESRWAGSRAVATWLLVMIAACGKDAEPISFDDGWGEAGELPAWRCNDSPSIVGSDVVPTWVVPERISGEVTRWTFDGNDRDPTIHAQQGSGPEHEGPCATADGDLFGIALPMGPMVDGESESHLFIGLHDGARSYDFATEYANASTPAIEVACSAYIGGYWPAHPDSGTVEVASVPSPHGHPLRIVAHAEGDCAFDLDVTLVFPPEVFDE